MGSTQAGSAVSHVEASAAAAALTIENERLRAELRRRLDELGACRRQASAAVYAERRRIERDLHDGAQGRLISLAMSLGSLESKLPTDPDAAQPIAREARRAVGAALEELRGLTQGIHPAILAERGLAVSLAELCQGAAVTTSLEVDLAGRLGAGVETAAYFVISEALTNAAKHARANEVRVKVSLRRCQLAVEVADDGIGGVIPGAGSGLRGIADRIEGLGGRVTLSSPPGRGTTIRAVMPCE